MMTALLERIPGENCPRQIVDHAPEFNISSFRNRSFALFHACCSTYPNLWWFKSSWKLVTSGVEWENASNYQFLLVCQSHGQLIKIQLLYLHVLLQLYSATVDLDLGEICSRRRFGRFESMRKWLVKLFMSTVTSLHHLKKYVSST